MEIDSLIIGSGAGGLSAAICLARAGERVLVLEQHTVPGGWCHSFYMNGYRFSPGVHYIGLLDKGESTNALYEGLGIANDLVFFRMNTAAYEHHWIGDQRIDLPANFDKLYQSLAARFPKEKKNLAKYMNTMRHVTNQLKLIPEIKSFWQILTLPWQLRHLLRYGLFSLKKVIDWHIKDPLLKNVLNMQCGNHGLAPNKVSFPLHCGVMDHYFNGGFYPMGGGGAIVKAMTNTIKKHGGEVRTSQRVKRILLEGNEQKRAVGVELESGEKIFAKRIISNTDPNKTYFDLIGADHLSKKLLIRLKKTTYSCTSLMLFLIVDMDVRQAGLDSGNIWMMPNKDINYLYQEMMKPDILPGDEFPGLLVSCTTLKDPASFDGRYHTLEIITLINHKSFNEFKDEGNEHSQKYEKFKERLTQKLLNSLEKVLPGISSKIVQKELGTPMTNEFYINTTNGCVYGTENNAKQTGPFTFKTVTEIENLYLCGASTLSHGVAGASYSGVQTAAAILQCRQEDLIKADASQNLRIYDAENPTDYPEWLKQKIQTKRARTEAGRDVFSGAKV